MSDMAQAAAFLKYEATKAVAASRNAIVVYRRLKSYGYEVVEWCSPPRPHTGGWWVVRVQRGETAPVYRSIRMDGGSWQIMPTPPEVLEHVMSAPVAANDNAGGDE
jgi:hypothetical protein